MKKITLFIAFAVCVFTIQAQITLTQSINPFTVDTGGVACWNAASGSYSANSFFRAYNLADFGVDEAFEISSVEYGQGTADEGKVLALRIYTADTDDLAVAVLKSMKKYIFLQLPMICLW